jgi:hypothetical protein
VSVDFDEDVKGQIVDREPVVSQHSLKHLLPADEEFSGRRHVPGLGEHYDRYDKGAIGIGQDLARSVAQTWG